MPIRNEFLETLTGNTPPPGKGWERGHVTVQFQYPDQRIPVEAWVRGAFAIHETIGGARLTHAPTGRRIWNWWDIPTVAKFADEIEPLTDWSAIKEKEPVGSKLYPKVKAVIDRYEDDDSADTE